MPPRARVFRSYVAVLPSPGGMEAHVSVLSQIQRQRGFEVTHAYSVGETDRPEDVRVLARWRILHWRPQVLRDLLFYAAVIVAVVRRRIRADVLHVHGDWAAFLCGRILGRVLGARLLIASMHGHVRPSMVRRLALQFGVARYGLCYATGRREAEALTAWTRRRWHWVTSGIAEAFFAAPVAQAVIYDVVTVANCVAVKNLRCIVDVAERLPGRTFCVAGSGPQLGNLRGEIAARRLANIRMTGQIERDEIPGLIAGARLFLLTSFHEGTPTVLLEAMACGVPIVTTPSNDYKELVGNGDGGYVTSGWASEEVAGVVDRVLSDEGAARSMGERNREMARRFSWDAVAKRIEDLMLARLNGGSPEALCNIEGDRS